MNNIDIHDTQLWAVALVGSFYNNLRKVPAHKRTTSVFESVNNLEPLHLYVTEIPQSEVVKIILLVISIRFDLRVPSTEIKAFLTTLNKWRDGFM